MRKVTPVNVYFCFVLFLVFLSPVLHVFKVAHINYDVGAFSFYIGFPLVVLFAWLCLLAPGSKRMTLGFSLLSLFFFFLFLYGLLVTLFEGGDYIDISGNCLRLLFCLGFIMLLRQRNRCVLFFVEKELMMARVSVLVLAVAVFAMYVAAASGYSVYFGLQSTIAFISLAYGLARNRWKFIVVSLVLIVASGKRGVMLGAVSMIFFYVFYLVSSGRIRVFFLLLFFLLSAAVITYQFDLVPQSISSRFSQFTSEGTLDWDRATAGRLTEVRAVMSVLDMHPSVLYFGSGFGAVIDIAGMKDSTVHFSPFGLMLIFGLPITLLIYLFVACVIGLGYFLSLNRGFPFRENILLWTLVLVGELVFSFTAFTILQSYVLWLSVLAVLSFSKAGEGRLD
ncbi:hypothetical protein GNE00_17380 [Pseudomonas sp. JL972]|uniref:hypothetical protein n=1 Tax=Stutzerimonas degradans TaxID=2968968 RepID=UPI0012D99DEB|nr:hypothetical protein [Stutzerimonas degradans]MTZ15526.1 hypothetical protein [Stutzerimonas degradans]